MGSCNVWNILRRGNAVIVSLRPLDPTCCAFYPSEMTIFTVRHLWLVLSILPNLFDYETEL